jgi:DNA polymerase-3 subunit gamma/tau
MSTLNLNLARKYRPNSLDGVVGQDKPLSMLKNSLFSNKFFPVYLFAGQRGCGKTSTARIFARALNCDALPQFQEDPSHHQLPCQACQSCRAMDQANHPDFIEIDGASHTGVDNVRTIIEASNYVPLLGRKKVYLIDEAHMLSKAAFNAFLKILEEPPPSVLFILATTEAHKIPSTVVSRCFQARFIPINHEPLINLLRTICTQEQIDINEEALSMIAYESEGSARDALNLLERVRLSDATVDTAYIATLLGKVNPTLLSGILSYLIAQQPAALLSFCKEQALDQLSAESLWDGIAQSLRSLLWIKYGATPPNNPSLPDYTILQEQADKCSINRLQAMIQLMLHHEPLFMKANRKHMVLEMVLLLICNQINAPDLADLMKDHQPESSPKTPKKQPPQTQKVQAAKPITPTPAPAAQPARIEKEAVHPEWRSFLDELQALDPMLHAIFAQAIYYGLEPATARYKLELLHDNSFIRDNIDDNKPVWLPILKKHIPDFTNFIITAQPPSEIPPTTPVRSRPPVATQAPPAAPSQPPSREYKNDYRKSTPQSTAPTDIKNPDKWPLTHLILSVFPGKIKRKVYN